MRILQAAYGGRIISPDSEHVDIGHGDAMIVDRVAEDFRSCRNLPVRGAHGDLDGDLPGEHQVDSLPNIAGLQG